MSDDHGHDHHEHEHHDRDHDHDHRHARGWWDRLRHAVTPHSHDSAGTVDRALESSRQGLSAAEARQRLERFGRNELAQTPPPPRWNGRA